jgi:hypothetical protein
VGVTANTGTGAMVRTASPQITTPDIVGTTAAGNAAAGSVGECVSSFIASGSAVALSRGCLLVRRSLGETLFKGIDGHLEIIAPLDQGPCQHWILDIRPVGNAGALLLGRDLAFDQLNGADQLNQYPTNHCCFARCLKTRLHTHLGAPDDLVRHT